jgi:hypothetical protein
MSDESADRVRVVIVGLDEAHDRVATILTYEVVNGLAGPIWLVADDWIVWRQEGEDIEIGLARVPLRPGVQVFGYFPPTVVEVAAGRSLPRALLLGWPLSLSGIWNATRRVERPHRPCRIRVRVGYGVRPAPEDPAPGEPVDAPVFRWQREAVSQPVEYTFDRAP